jgi:menaquinone-dependent protoporphyrinogen oxidase
MNRILVTYATMAGSTAEVAQAIAAACEATGAQVDVKPVAADPSPEGYDAVIVGGPMIVGWHRQALGYVKRHRSAWSRTPLAVFVLAMSLTQPAETVVDGLPIVVDAGLPKPPHLPGRLSFRERHTQLGRYVGPILAAARPGRPVSVGVFGGRLEYGRLPWWGVLFAMGVIQAPAGDRRDWEAIQAWAAGLPVALAQEPFVV